MPNIRNIEQSPFYSRSYGGFTQEQRQFYMDIIGDPRGKTILDPMAGQAYYLSNFPQNGARVHIGDINPAPLLLAYLRSSKVIGQYELLGKWMDNVLKRLDKFPPQSKPMARIDTWVAPASIKDLREYSLICGLNEMSSPYLYSSAFWNSSTEKIFAVALVVLAARKIACFRTSRNLTWLRPGGVLREPRIVKVLKDALFDWILFASNAQSDLNTTGLGALLPSRMDASKGEFGQCNGPDIIITSPPYANRLDYTRMWAPESYLLAALFQDSDVDIIKRNQIGSIVVRGKPHKLEEIELLPTSVHSALRQIHDDPTSDSKKYYFPFFMEYAITLSAAFRNMSKLLSNGAFVIVFVRDTVRKDVMFPAGELITQVLTECSCREVNVHRKVIRHHIGFVRKASARGLHGPAQLEWWLAFRKET